MSTKTNLILDLSIFTAFLAVANPTLTGMEIHEWLALAFGAAITTHLLFHWDWLVAVTRRFTQKSTHRSRLNYIVNLLFFLAMTAAMLSGVLISKTISGSLGIHLEVSRQWKTLHNLASDLSLVLLGVHFALHLKWVLFNLKRYLVAPLRRRLLSRPGSGKLAVQPVRIEKNH